MERVQGSGFRILDSSLQGVVSLLTTFKPHRETASGFRGGLITQMIILL
jgi:hypothetical protein